MFSVAYGEPTGPLTAPVDVGLLDPVEQITIGRAGLDGVVDGTDEMVVMVKQPDGLRSATLIAGTSSRRVRSPFAITKISSTGVTVAYAPTRAAIGRGIELGAGAIVLAGVAITAAAEIGCHVVAMPNAVVTHDDVLEDYVTLTAGVALGGGVRLGEASTVGMNASVRPGVRIGRGATVGMGAAVLADVPDGETWAGVPAKPLRHHHPEKRIALQGE